MDRRQLLALLAAGTATALTGCSADPAPHRVTPRLSGPTGTPAPSAVPATPTVPPAAANAPKAAIPAGNLTALPGAGSNLALTVDDGASAEVVGAYIQFAKDSGARFTFFVTAYYDAWTTHKAALRPLVESGQIQLGNHTWDHPDLTKLSATEVSTQLTRTKTFLRNNFGVDGTPYFRPPFGYHNASVDKVAAELGYTVPTLWYGSLSDSGVITEDYLIECARKYFNAQAIVIGHANHPAVTHCYGRLLDIIRERKLSLVTLNDVLVSPA
ncbi:polysaccharide deacetylase family protein [Nocardia yunnanensis]|uniref:Polysaccharide deacetylase family protein n=1 Tax=Nocardia yunnanensis TaxID=2382165 RepID=A0A386ZET7_9NOCA|nr:polysaccharide deacetylase family protein [Nocardia yunnanensis]AYF76036.1 polysaccharide deacetylase family protein [Nocardia yunnanensis]